MPIEIIAIAPARESRAPSAGLVRAAGDFASAVARLWPRPHRPYFEAPPERRHLMHFVAERVSKTADAEAAAEALATWSARRVIAAYLPDAPAGFAEALKRLVGDRWRAADYDRLWGLLGDPGVAGKAVRHEPAISAGFLGVLVALPERLRSRAVAGLIRSADEARLVAEGVALARGRGGAHAEPRIAEILSRAGSRQAMFSRLIDLIGERIIEAGDVPGADWLRPILGPAAMRDAALRFANCLEHRVPLALSGAAAYYEALGQEPAIVEIVRSPAGAWRFGEMRGLRNIALSRGLLNRIEAHLALHGVQPWGRATTIVDRLAAAIYP